jgi:nuclear transport factor 2 (NTF2) superfamily protein
MQQSGGNQETRPPVPPFNEETARQKVKAAQDAWNTREASTKTASPRAGDGRARKCTRPCSLDSA